jgi:DNA-binding MarR family transcriptional regulator
MTTSADYRPPLTASRPELLDGGNDETFRKLIHETLAFATRIQEIRGRFAELLGLSDTGYSILIAVAHLGTDTDIGINGIADYLHLTGAFVTNEVAKLVNRQLLDKKDDPNDRRRVILTITTKGKQALEQLAPTQTKVNDILFETLSAAEFKAQVKIMTRMVGCGDRALALLDYLAVQDRQRA